MTFFCLLCVTPAQRVLCLQSVWAVNKSLSVLWHMNNVAFLIIGQRRFPGWERSQVWEAWENSSRKGPRQHQRDGPDCFQPLSSLIWNQSLTSLPSSSISIQFDQTDICATEEHGANYSAIWIIHCIIHILVEHIETSLSWAGLGKMAASTELGLAPGFFLQGVGSLPLWPKVCNDELRLWLLISTLRQCNRLVI